MGPHNWCNGDNSRLAGCEDTSSGAVLRSAAAWQRASGGAEEREREGEGGRDTERTHTHTHTHTHTQMAKSIARAFLSLSLSLSFCSLALSAVDASGRDCRPPLCSCCRKREQVCAGPHDCSAIVGCASRCHSPCSSSSLSLSLSACPPTSSHRSLAVHKDRIPSPRAAASAV